VTSTPPTPRTSPSRSEGLIVAAFLLATLAALGLAVVYARGGQPQLEGALLGVALLGLGTGLVLWAHHLLPRGPFAEPREPFGDATEQAEFESDLERGGVVTRRRLIVGSFGAALVAMLTAFAFPIRSLGPSPGNALRTTKWRRGTRAITSDGDFVRASNVPLGGLVTIFPEGDPDSADGQVVLVRVREDQLDLPRGRRDWAPDGLVAYSKVCTHAGCPVGLYEAAEQTLLCPCHQSAFDVLTGATPVFGPAARALPQLPIEIDDEGFIVAQSDFHEPVGPSFWTAP